MSQRKTTNLRTHAKELIESRADSGLEVYYDLRDKAKRNNDDAMVRHWTRRIEERRRFLERINK